MKVEKSDDRKESPVEYKEGKKSQKNKEVLTGFTRLTGFKKRQSESDTKAKTLSIPLRLSSVPPRAGGAAESRPLNVLHVCAKRF